MHALKIVMRGQSKSVSTGLWHGGLGADCVQTTSQAVKLWHALAWRLWYAGLGYGAGQLKLSRRAALLTS